MYRCNTTSILQNSSDLAKYIQTLYGWNLVQVRQIHVPMKTIRKQINYTPQSIILFNDSMKGGYK